MGGSGWAGIVFRACNPISVSIYGWRVETGQAGVAPADSGLKSNACRLNKCAGDSVCLYMISTTKCQSDTVTY